MAMTTTAPSPSHHLARLIGPALLTISIAESVNAHIWASSSHPTIFLNGSIIFVSGLAIVRHHNLWTTGWPVLVTLSGWSGLALGLTRMLVPEMVLESVKKAKPRDVRAGALVVAAVGGALTLCGYLAA
ncbi:hypothetical protein A1O7_00774 [Cladophialophora yegresii CBS 114405]|uniref:Uncharacterized protein n=1 Tax=Cladophialophora yegresii CBS 114405 TaxID=1182544 RepID=W9W928_9EURO|nr:uncharacterized protein A1O7_00774 [Cladophialophora yegresii CBS 114405]EXJ64438.1 hypothetical protein A1O7_00774 [Cladophialophora yegresii CBS 114405]